MNADRISSGWFQPSGRNVRRRKHAIAFFQALPLQATDGQTADLVDISPPMNMPRDYFFCEGRVRINEDVLKACFSVNRDGEFMWWAYPLRWETNSHAD